MARSAMVLVCSGSFESARTLAARSSPDTRLGLWRVDASLGRFAFLAGSALVLALGLALATVAGVLAGMVFVASAFDRVNQAAVELAGVDAVFSERSGHFVGGVPIASARHKAFEFVGLVAHGDLKLADLHARRVSSGDLTGLLRNRKWQEGTRVQCILRAQPR